MIIGAAIQHNGITICLPKPNRHHHCIHYAVYTLGIKPPVGHKGKQGFYLEDGTFLDRVQAKEYAIKVGQVTETKFKELYSEDLW